jgi:hypothetical protein
MSIAQAGASASAGTATVAVTVGMGTAHENEYLVEARAAGFRWGSWDRSLRNMLVSRYSWAIPNEEALQAIARHSPRGLVEIGAGTGYWASLLQANGLSVFAYDSCPPRTRQHTNSYFRYDRRGVVGTLWTEVKRGGARRAADHPERTLFLCWPPYNAKMAANALKAYAKAGGTTLAYIGEGAGGCTADDSFHEMLAEGWEEVESVAIPRWSGMHDALIIWRRK